MAGKYISESWFSERWPTTIFSSCLLPPWYTATGMGAGTQKQSKDMSWEQENSNFISFQEQNHSKVVSQIIRCVIRAMDELISDHVAWDNKTAWVVFTFAFIIIIAIIVSRKTKPLWLSSLRSSSPHHYLGIFAKSQMPRWTSWASSSPKTWSMTRTGPRMAWWGTPPESRTGSTASTFPGTSPLTMPHSHRWVGLYSSFKEGFEKMFFPDDFREWRRYCYNYNLC